MQKFIFTIREPGLSSINYQFTVEASGISGQDDQWARDLADFIAANAPSSLGWSSPGTVENITAWDDSRSVTPNP